jgi:guanylate cyclase
MGDWARNWLQRIGGIGADPRDDKETALRKRIMVNLALGTSVSGVLWGVMYWLAGAPMSGVIPVAYAVVSSLVNTTVFAVTRHFPAYRFVQALMTLVLPFLLMLSLGGFAPSSGVIIWASLAPVAALILDDLDVARLWLAAYLGLLVIGALVEPYLTPAPLPAWLVATLFVLNIATVVSIAFFVLRHFVRQRNFYEERSEMLLLNILPKEIADILRNEPRTIARQHDQTSILFADAVGFTKLSAALGPMQTVTMLDEVFLAFDGLADRYDVEKIKTIGDCYMVAAGVPRPRADHAKALVSMALDMRDLVRSRTFGGQRLAFRIGINSGPVVAGVIGRRKFIYDLWGDAVNLASRMESHGEEGVIQITRATCELVSDAFVCEPRGLVEIKGGGRIEAWHVLGRRPESNKKLSGERRPAA